MGEPAAQPEGFLLPQQAARPEESVLEEPTPPLEESPRMERCRLALGGDSVAPECRPPRQAQATRTSNTSFSLENAWLDYGSDKTSGIARRRRVAGVTAKLPHLDGRETWNAYHQASMEPSREETMTMLDGVAAIYHGCCRLALFALGFLALFDADEELSGRLD
jgi:hypothetical protein